MKRFLRNDLQIISNLINNNEKILDVGCGDGNLIEYLSTKKNGDCKGIEIELKNVKKNNASKSPKNKQTTIISKNTTI